LAEALTRLYTYLKEEDDTLLIATFKSVVEDAPRSQEMIARVLYKRQSKEVDKFFEDYKTVFNRV